MKPQIPDHRRSVYWPIFVLLSSLVIGSPCAIAEDDAKVHYTGHIKLTNLTEISGVAVSRQNPDILWMHNDGKSRQVFAFNPSGKLAALVNFPGEIEDFEDIALGPGPKAGVDYLYIGDIGDNYAERHEVRVVRFAEPKISEARGGQIVVEAVEVFRLVYPDGAHNAEALIVDPVSGDLFIVTKEKQSAYLFTCPAGRLKDNALIHLESLAALDVFHITGGDIARDGSRIILRGDDRGWLWNRVPGQSIGVALKTRPREIPVLGSRQGPKGEAVSFTPDGKSYFTVSEGKRPMICEFQLPAPDAVPPR